MSIFQIKPKLDKIDVSGNFLSGGFISISMEDLPCPPVFNKERIKDHLIGTYGLSGRKLSQQVGIANDFFLNMQSGDTILMVVGGYLCLGTLGDYQYLEDAEKFKHRRLVQWKFPINIAKLTFALPEFLKDRAAITKYNGSDTDLLSDLNNAVVVPTPPTVYKSTTAPKSPEITAIKQRAIEILVSAMESKGGKGQVVAAAALLEYLK